MKTWGGGAGRLLVAAAALMPLLAVLAPPAALSEELPSELECPSESVQRNSENRLQTWCEDADGTRNGPFLKYREGGEKSQAGHYVNGSLHGEITHWLRDGTPWIHHRWYGVAGLVMDDPSGVCPEGSTRIDEGALGYHNERSEGCYRRSPQGDALRHGPQTGFTGRSVPAKGEQARRLYQTDYRYGLKHGWVRDWWYSNGNLRNERSYQYGKSHGLSRYWNETGELREEISFEHGVHHGRSRYWEADGALRWSATFENGHVVRFEGDFTVDGRACPTDAVPIDHRPPKKDGPVIECVRFEDGSKRIRNGPQTRWYASGKKAGEREYRENEEAGIWRGWSEDALPGSEGRVVRVYATGPEGQELSATGVIQYYGDLVHEVTEQSPKFSFRDYQDPPTVYEPRIVIEDSRFELFGLPPGLYLMKTTARIWDSAGESRLIGDRRRLRIKQGEVATLKVKLKTSDVTEARIRGVCLLGVTLFLPILFAGVLTPIVHRCGSPSPRRVSWWGIFLATGVAAPLLLYVEDPPEKVILWVAFSVLMIPGAVIGSWAASRWLTRHAHTNAAGRASHNPLDSAG